MNSLFPNNWTGRLLFDQESIEIFPFKSGSFHALYFDLDITKIQQGRTSGYRVRWTLHPKQPLLLKACSLSIPFSFEAHHRFLANGYQSWSGSKELDYGAPIPRLRLMAKRYFRHYGDDFLELPKKVHPNAYSWSFGHVRMGIEHMTFLGSLNEQFAFTLIEYDLPKRRINVHLDVANLQLEHSIPLMDFVLLEGPELEIKALYQSLQVHPPKKSTSLWGWNSWYHYYRAITPTKLRNALKSVVQSDFPAQVFQIDDGFQSAVGDWLQPKTEFRGQMPELAKEIKSNGLMAGLWLAPMVADKTSQIYKRHPDWLLRDTNGQLLRVGYNPLWGGWYFGLNFYHQEVQQFLTRVFQTVTQRWGYQFLKLDFLFAACLAPPPNKTRAQVMSEVLDFIRKLCPDTLLLGCGVPLGSAAGRMDYCRIGPDTHLAWDHGLLRFLRKRERVSTYLAVQTIVSRWWLNGLWFGSDPDVFIMRPDAHQLTEEVQRTLLLTTAIFGSLHFTSDLPGEYHKNISGEVAEAQFWANAQVNRVQWPSKDLMEVHFELDNRHWRMLINWRQKAVSWPDMPTLELAPGESLILHYDNNS